jgi:hypothetical protein
MKVGDKVRIIDVGSGGFKLGTSGEIVGVLCQNTEDEFFDVAVGATAWFYTSDELELVNPEPKGKCLTDATQVLYTALKKLTETATKVEVHLIAHPYQRALVEAIHVAQEAIDAAENGELGEVSGGCEKGRTGCGVCLGAPVTTNPRINLTFPDPICTSWRTNHEV